MSCRVCLEEAPPEEGLLLRTFGIEAEEIKKRLKGLSFSLRESLRGADLFFEKEEDRKRARELIGSYVYTDRPEDIEETLGRVLKERGLTLSVAESCTGGLLGARIVNVPGSSAYFLGGVIAYSNELKIQLLCVNEETLKRYGAVSRWVCLEMLAGLKRNFGSDCGIAVTGIAGPGGSTQKPEGLTYIGLYVGKRFTVIKRIFRGSRNEKRFLSTQTAFFYLLKMLNS